MNLEIIELRILRQVSEGAVTVHDGGYVQGGCPIAGELTQALVRLHLAGCVTMGPPGPGGHHPVKITTTGADRLAELRRQHH